MTRRGAEWHVRVRQGESWSGSRGASWQGAVWLGRSWPGSAVEARHLMAGIGTSGNGTAVMERLGEARYGSAVRGMSWHGSRGMAGHVEVGSVKVWHGSRGWACPVRVRLGASSRGSAVASGSVGVGLVTVGPGPARQSRKPRVERPATRKEHRMSDATVQIDRIDAETIQVPIVGTTPLIVHRFSEKAKKQMLDAMQGKRTPKQSKDPEAEYQSAFYKLKDGRYGFPAVGFKQAMVSATRLFGKDVTMVLVRQTIFVHGEAGTDQPLVPIEGEPHMREDVVTVGRGGHDLRYRPEFPEWRADVILTYVKASFTRGSVLTLLDAAGLGVGVGEWRPEKNGDFGQFKIDETRDVEVIQ